MSYFYLKHWTLLLSWTIVIVQIVCNEDNGASRDNLFYSSASRESFNFFDTSTTETTPKFGDPRPTNPNPWYDDISTGKVVTLILLSFSLPVGFMLLLLWRLHKEKKYMNARAGALVYRETVLVPSYTISNDTNPNSNSVNSDHTNNLVQMHTALYDTPPNYEEVINSSTNIGPLEKKNGKAEDIPPPPSYSTVYM